MAMSDPLGDMLARIKNGQHANKKTIKTPASKLRTSVLDVLKNEGYIRGFSEAKDERGLPFINIELKYFDGEPVIHELQRVSKPGRRVYAKVGELPRVFSGLGVSILSTPRGVMTDTDARAANVGGEILCKVF